MRIATITMLLGVLTFIQGWPIQEMRDGTTARHRANKEVRTIISAIVDAVLDGDRKRRSETVDLDDEKPSKVKRKDWKNMKKNMMHFGKNVKTINKRDEQEDSVPLADVIATSDVKSRESQSEISKKDVISRAKNEKSTVLNEIGSTNKATSSGKQHKMKNTENKTRKERDEKSSIDKSTSKISPSRNSTYKSTTKMKEANVKSKITTAQKKSSIKADSYEDFLAHDAALFSQKQHKSLEDNDESYEVKEKTVDRTGNFDDMRAGMGNTYTMNDKNAKGLSNGSVSENDLMNKQYPINENEIMNKNHPINENDSMDKNHPINENDSMDKNHPINENDSMDKNHPINENDSMDKTIQ
ncbi:component of gems protein 5-like isoform X2 [Xenia sp. Carnegie-2017]|uniref:component of gems protein 5-like isoform X2 n=1 Tax=Xenia sp. Carnegie-2017 TaxID=2897299 RepID=UPI001F03730C|nr:component of gems protein 5-like isoform X2 [Xenia sp. Carnegie-2017]